MSFDAGSVLGHISLDSSGYEAGAQKVAQHSQNMAGEMFKAQAMFAAFQKGLQLVTDFLKQSTEKFIEHEKAEAQLNAVLKSTGGIAGMTSKSINDLADSLSRSTTFSKDAIMQGENLLLTFTNIGKDIFPQATETVLNMAAALGEDLKSASIQVGKALQDPILGVTALRRVGVNFTKDQTEVIKKLVETGQSAKAQQMILKELATEFGGSARAIRDTFGGSLAAAKNRFEEFQIVIGDYIAKIGKPFVDMTVNMMDSVNNFLGSAQGMQQVESIVEKVAEGFAVLKVIFDDIMGVIGKVAKMFGDDLSENMTKIMGKGNEANTAFSLLAVTIKIVEAAFMVLAKIIKADIDWFSDLLNIVLKSSDLLAKSFDAMLHPMDQKKMEALAKSSDALIGAFVTTGLDVAKNYTDIIGTVWDAINKTGDKTNELADKMADAAIKAKQKVDAAFSKGGGSAVAPHPGYTPGMGEGGGSAAAAGTPYEVNAVGASQAQSSEAWFPPANVINDAVAEFDKSYSKIANVVSDTVSKMQAVWDQYFQNQLTQISNDYTAKHDALDKQYQDDITASENSNKTAKEKSADQTKITKDYNDKKTAMDKEQKAKEAAIKKQQFEADKMASIISATISGIDSVIKTFSEFGWPWGIIPAGIMGGIAAAQVAMIMSQPTPAFASGGVAQPGWAIVGEKGPEAVHIGETSRIYSAADTAAMKSNQNVQQHNYYGDINGIDNYNNLSESQARILRGLVRQL